MPPWRPKTFSYNEPDLWAILLTEHLKSMTWEQQRDFVQSLLEERIGKGDKLVRQFSAY